MIWLAFIGGVAVGTGAVLLWFIWYFKDTFR